jgi:hypothetical protein
MSRRCDFAPALWEKKVLVREIGGLRDFTSTSVPRDDGLVEVINRLLNLKKRRIRESPWQRLCEPMRILRSSRN